MSRFFASVIFICVANYAFPQAVVNVLNHNTDNTDTYQSTCVGVDGSFYGASSYGSAHDFQGETIEMLNPSASQEVLVVKYLNNGSIDWKKRITISASNATVGKIEFMAVDANGYLYLSTQGTSSGQFLKIENDSIALSGVGNRVIQLYPNGKLRSIRSFNNQIHNLCAHGNHIYVNGLTNFNGPHIAKYDSLFTDPIWVSQGSSSFFLGASAFDRLQMNCSPSGEYIAFLSIDAGQTLTWGGTEIPQLSTQTFDELVAVVIDSTGTFQFAKTFLNSTGLSPLSIAVDDNANLYLGCYTLGTGSFAGIEYAPEPNYNSNYSLIIKTNNLGLEEWAVQCSASSQAPRFEGLNIDLDGNLLFAGSAGGNVEINDEVVLTLNQGQPFAGRINQDGELDWILGATTVENSCRFYRIYPLQENIYVVSALGFFASSFQCYGEILGDFNYNHFIAIIDASEALPISASPSFLDNFLEVSFESNASNGSEYAWDFGDGSSSNEMNPTHTYSAPGIYTVSLTVSNCQYDEIFEMEVQVQEEIIQSINGISSLRFSAYILSDNQIQIIGENSGDFFLYDVTGKLIFFKNSLSLPITLTVPSITPGVYQLIFKSNNEIFTKKIVFN